MPKRMNTELFRKKMKEIHGDKYDFSESEYDGAKNRVYFKCPVHGLIYGQPFNLLRGSGCRLCGIAETREKKSLTRGDVEAKLKEIHGDDLYFENIPERPKKKDRIDVYCKIHGKFPSRPDLWHLLVKKTGCRSCKTSRGLRKRNKRDYVSDFIKIHGNKYDYSEFKFTDSQSKVVVICPEHGPFSVSISNHLKGRGCRDCGIQKQSEARTAKPDAMIKKFNRVHDSKYTYEKMVWVNYHTEITITCPKHGDFTQDPRNHGGGKGCPSCKVEKLTEYHSHTIESFISACREKHGDLYDYSEVDYKNSQIDVNIICKEHGSFIQRPAHHLAGAGCSKCYNKSEGRIAKFLHLNFITYRQFSIKNRRFDFYLPDFDLIVERDGEQHYHGFHLLADDEKLESLAKNHQTDIEKTALAKQEGLTICRLPYWLNTQQELTETINIIHGKPTYPDVPDLNQVETQPLPVIWEDIDYEGYVTTDKDSEAYLDSFFDEDGQGSFDF